MSLLEQLRNCTVSVCFECSSVHDLHYNYMQGYYSCEECYREVSIQDMPGNELLIWWDKLKHLVVNSSTPKKMLKMLLHKVLHMEYTQEQINAYLQELVQTGVVRNIHRHCVYSYIRRMEG